MYSLIPAGIITDHSVSCQVRLYFCWLCERSNRAGQSWWGIERTARDFGVSTRTVQRWRGTLVKKGWITTQQMGRLSVISITSYPNLRHEPTPPPSPSDSFAQMGAALKRALGAASGGWVTPDVTPRTSLDPTLYRSGEPTPATDTSPHPRHPMSRKGDTPCHPNQNPEEPELDSSSSATYSRSVGAAVVGQTIDRLVRIAGEVGLISFGGRLPGLIDRANRERIQALSFLTDEALRFAFEYQESLRGTRLYPITTSYLLDQLLLRGSMVKPETKDETHMRPDETPTRTDETKPEPLVPAGATAPTSTTPDRWAAFLDWMKQHAHRNEMKRWFDPLSAIDTGEVMIIQTPYPDDVEMFRYYFGRIMDSTFGAKGWNIEVEP